MDDKTTNAIIKLRTSGTVPPSMSDDEVGKLIAMGDALRAAMTPEVEVEYDELQQLAITCSIVFEVENDDDLFDFDFDGFDENFEKEFFVGETVKTP